MQPVQLLELLQQKEIALHNTEVRASVSQLDALLHESFCEFSRSGESYGKQEALEQLPTETSGSTIRAQNFLLDWLSSDIALLRYQSFQQSETGKIQRHSNRSSLWQHSDMGWQLRFHQSTATAAFAFKDVSPLKSSH